MTLIDFGACIGEFTDVWLSSHPQSSVICVEPDPANLKVLHEKFSNNSSVTIVGCAVDIESGKRDFYEGTSRTNGSLCAESSGPTQYKQNHGDVAKVSVDCLTIDDIIRENSLDITNCSIKLDVEGLEHRLLNCLYESSQVPNTIYFDDGCRKTSNEDEWKARIKFYNDIRAGHIDPSTIFVETACYTKGAAGFQLQRAAEFGDDAVTAYAPIETHYAFQTLRNPTAAIENLLDEAKRKLVQSIQVSDEINEIVQIPGIQGWEWIFTKPCYMKANTPIGPSLPAGRQDVIRRWLNDNVSNIPMGFFDTTKSDLVVGIPKRIFVYWSTINDYQLQLKGIPVLDPWNPAYNDAPLPRQRMINYCNTLRDEMLEKRNEK
jgi:FkbM family methyltransferase